MDEDLAAGDVGYEGVFTILLPLSAQDGEFLGPEEVGGLFGQRDADKEMVEVLGEEAVQTRLVQPAEPGVRDRTVRVARVGDDEPRVAFRFGRRARRGRVREDGHAHPPRHAGDLAADAAVAEDAEPFSGLVSQIRQFRPARPFAPFVLLLPRVEKGVIVRVGQHGQDDPFGDLWAVDAG